MGEYAEMMLDGTCCEGCGEFLGGGAPGFPRYCRSCRPRSASKPSPSVKRPPPAVAAASLSPKLVKRLEWIRLRTDHHSSMYPGDYYDAATKQHQQLIGHGLVKIFDPHNPAHKTRVVITNAGRALLKSTGPAA